MYSDCFFWGAWLIFCKISILVLAHIFIHVTAVINFFFVTQIIFVSNRPSNLTRDKNNVKERSHMVIFYHFKIVSLCKSYLFSLLCYDYSDICSSSHLRTCFLSFCSPPSVFTFAFALM